MKIFVTGGAGFIGEALTQDVTHQWLVYDTFRHGEPGCQVPYVHGDVRDRETLGHTMAMFAPDMVIHMASIAGVDAVRNHPLDTIDTTLMGTRNIISVCGDIPIIFLSTSEVCGVNAFQTHEFSLGHVEEVRWVYAVSKLQAEQMLLHTLDKVAVVRPYNVFGSTQKGQSAIITFSRRASRDEPITVYNGGSQVRSWCFIDDFVQGMRCLIKNFQRGVYAIGHPGNSISVYSLAELVKHVLSSKSEIVMEERKEVDIGIRCPDTTAIEQLGYVPRFSLIEGIKRLQSLPS